MLYENLELSDQVAAPQLPMRTIHIALPPGKKIQDILIEDVESEFLEGQFLIQPDQPPHVLSQQNVRSVSPDQDIYSSPNPYPQEIMKVLQSQSNSSGANVAGIAISPIQYFPGEKKLKFYSRLGVCLVLKDTQRMTLAFRKCSGML